MTDTVYHPTTPELSALRRELAPAAHEAFEDFGRAVFAHALWIAGRNNSSP